MEKSILATEQGNAPALSKNTIPVPDCRYPGRGSCRGCEYSFAPDLFDGGCLAEYSAAERQRIRETCALPDRRI